MMTLGKAGSNRMAKDDISGNEFWLESEEDVLRRRMVKGEAAGAAKKPQKPTPKPVKDIAEPGTYTVDPLKNKESQASEKSQKAATDGVTKIAFEIKMPKISVPPRLKIWFSTVQEKLPPVPRLGRSYSKRTRVITATLVALALVGAVFLLNNLGAGNNKNPGAASTQAKQKPDFQPLVSVSKLKESKDKGSPEVLGLKYEPVHKVISLTDKYQDVSLVISLQQLPKDQASKPETLLKIASSIKADKPLQTSKGTLFIGTDSKNENLQTGVFLQDGLLVFIRTNKKMDDNDWETYVGNLLVAN